MLASMLILLTLANPFGEILKLQNQVKNTFIFNEKKYRKNFVKLGYFNRLKIIQGKSFIGNEIFSSSLKWELKI